MKKNFNNHNNYNKSKIPNKKTLYVVHKGHNPGIYNTWDECKKNVDKYEGAIFKKFTDEKEANEFLINGFGINIKPKSVVRKENMDKKNNNKILDAEMDDSIFIYTDGSCIRMKNGLIIAGYGIYIPSKNISVASPLLKQKLTNNRAEMTAIIEAIKYLDEEDKIKKINILTDSQYSMYLFHGTGERYRNNGYKNNGKDVPNIDLIKKLLDIKKSYNIDLLKIRAHTGKKDIHSINNEIADKLANQGAFSSIQENKKGTTIFNMSDFEIPTSNIDVDSIIKDSDEDVEYTNNYNIKESDEEYNENSDIESDEDVNTNNTNQFRFFKSNLNNNNNNTNNNNNNNNNYDDYSDDNDNNIMDIRNIPNRVKIYDNKKINKNIQMNELFEFDELGEDETNKLLRTTKKSKSTKSLKLSNWFIKKDVNDK